MSVQRRRATGAVAAIAATGLLCAQREAFVAAPQSQVAAPAAAGFAEGRIASVGAQVAPPAVSSVGVAAAAAGLAGVAALAAQKKGTRPQRVARQFFGGGGSAPPAGTIYDYTVKDIDGAEVSLKQYEGKVVLFVNLASA